MIACRECSQEFKYYANRLRHEKRVHGPANRPAHPPNKPSPSPEPGANEAPLDPEPELIDLDAADYADVDAKFSGLPPNRPVGEPGANEDPLDPGPEPIDHEAVKAAMSVDELGEMLIALSRTLSSFDGAGEAGVFTPLEAKSLAYMFYDPVISMIENVFGGNAGRFKMIAGVVIILLGKGRVHYQAIKAKKSKPKPGPETVEQDNSAQPEQEDSTEPEQYDAPVDFKALAQLQKAGNEDD